VCVCDFKRFGVGTWVGAVDVPDGRGIIRARFRFPQIRVVDIGSGTGTREAGASLARALARFIMLVWAMTRAASLFTRAIDLVRLARRNAHVWRDVVVQGPGPAVGKSFGGQTLVAVSRSVMAKKRSLNASLIGW